MVGVTTRLCFGGALIFVDVFFAVFFAIGQTLEMFLKNSPSIRREYIQNLANPIDGS